MKQLNVAFGSLALSLFCGCASICERQTLNNSNRVGQSMWKYDRGPYPGVGLYCSNFTDEKKEPSTPDMSKSDAVVIFVLVFPFWITDVCLTTCMDTILLPYDLIKWEKQTESNKSSDPT